MLESVGTRRHNGITVALLGFMALAALVGFAAVTGANDDATRVLSRPPVSEPAGAPVAGKVSGGVPAELVALRGDRVVVLDAHSGAERRVLATHRPGRDEPGVTLQGIAVTPDGRDVYYATVTDDDWGTVHRVATDGRRPARVISDGMSPAISPDGRYLAYAAPGPSEPGGPDRCCNTIAVVTLDPGTLRIWGFPASDLTDRVWVTQASFTKLAWAPDSRRLAFTVSYEGETVAVLDTVAHPDLAATLEVVVPDGGGNSQHPAWQTSSGRLAIANKAFDCCFEDDYRGGPRTLLVDVDERLSEELLPPGTTPTWLDFDTTGDHLLFVDDGVLYRRSHQEAPVKVGSGIAAADW
jgi:hypothetical protein